MVMMKKNRSSRGNGRRMWKRKQLGCVSKDEETENIRSKEDVVRQDFSVMMKYV